MMRQSAASLAIARLISASALAALPHQAAIPGSLTQRRMRKRSSGVAGRRLGSDGAAGLAGSAISASRQAGGERCDRIGCSREVALAREARATAGAQVVVAVAGPVEADGRRQPIGGDLGPSAERVALALHD